MKKKQNVIEINGQRYDAHSGTALDRTARPITVQVQNAPPKDQHHKRPARKPARHADRHKLQRSDTLMRKAVHKPPASLKRHVKVQSNTAALVEQPPAEIAHSPMFNASDSKRLRRAESVKKSQLITHFNPNMPAYQSGHSVPVTVKKPASAAAKPSPKTVPRQPAPDIDAIFDRAIQNATSHLEPAPQPAKKRRLHLTRKHARATHAT